MADDKQPEKKPMSKRLIILIIAVVVAIVIGIIVVFIHGSNSTKDGVLSCSTQSCFNGQFAKCSPAEFKTKDPSTGVTFEYQINRMRDKYCEVTFTNQITLSNGKKENASISCNYDNKINFLDSEQQTDKDPSAYDCKRVVGKDAN